MRALLSMIVGKTPVTAVLFFTLNLLVYNNGYIKVRARLNGLDKTSVKILLHHGVNFRIGYDISVIIFSPKGNWMGKDYTCNEIRYDKNAKKYLVFIGKKRFKLGVYNMDDVYRIINFCEFKMKIPKHYKGNDKYSFFIKPKIIMENPECLEKDKNKLWDYYTPYIKKEGKLKEIAKTYLAKTEK